MTSTSITDWISAISSAVLGGLAVFITLWQWTASGFRPRLSARIEKARTAIELRVRNKGRATGIIDRVVVVKPRDDLLVRVNARFDSFPDGNFQAIALLGLAQMKIIIEPLEDNQFPENVQLKVELGRKKDQYLTPDLVSEVSLRGLKSVLPPSAFAP
jgi:hypothetical protein